MKLDHDLSVTEIVGSVVAILVVIATVILALRGEAQAQTALTSLSGAVAGMYLQRKITNGNGTTETAKQAAPK